MAQEAPARVRAAAGRRTQVWHVAASLGLAAAAAAVAYLTLRGRPAGPPAPPAVPVSAERLKAALAQADQLDPGWRFEELEAARQAVPDGENAALQVRRAAVLIPESWTPQTLQLARERLRGQKPGQPSPRIELQPLEAALAEGRKLAALPRGRYPVAWDWQNPLATPLPHAEDPRLTELLALDAEVRAYDGDMAGAFDSLAALLNVGRALGDEPTLESQMVRAGVHAQVMQALEQVLSRGEAPAEALAGLQRRLADEAAYPLLLVAARGDRAGLHGLLLTLETGELARGDLTPPPPGTARHSRTAAVRAILSDPALYNEDALRYAHAWLLDYTSRYVEIARLPPHEQPAKLQELIPRSWSAPPAAKPLVPAVSEMTLVYQRSQAALRCCVAALAAERSRLARGRWPKAPADLAPDFLAGAPVDPFDGGPLRLARHGEGIVLYAVDADGKDNGGEPERLNTFRPKGDIGLRLWDAARRKGPK